MQRFRCAVLAALGGIPLAVATLAAQIDYRNLDDGRPVLTEDAYPVERYALELLAPFAFATGAGAQQYLLGLGAEYGLLANTQVGLRIPLAVDAASGRSEAGLAGLGAAALYNLNTESSSLPALSLRGDLDFPVGSLSGDDLRFSLKAIATHSWGLWRAHLNFLGSVGSDGTLGIDALPRWAGSVAVDRTLFRQSLLLVGELAAFQASSGDPTAATAALGLRWQWTPTLVFDAGVSRRLTSTGPDVAVTLGFSHVVAFSGLMPLGRSTEVPHAPAR